jgi:hypothetical protein
MNTGAKPLLNSEVVVTGSGLGYLSRYSDSLLAGPSGNRTPVGGEIFRTRSIPALGPTQPPVQWVSGLSWG